MKTDKCKTNYTNCAKCRRDAHCCVFKKTSEFAFVGINDARRIKRFIKKGYDYFLDYSQLPKNAIKQLKNGDPALEGALRYKQLDKNRLLRLKSKKNKNCIFLNKNNCCEIYNVRPNVCRIYPFWAVNLISGKIKVIPHGPDSKCQNLKAMNQPWESVESGLSKREISGIKQTFKQIEKENEYYIKNIKKFKKELKK